jgi:isochorismate hydrolase
MYLTMLIAGFVIACICPPIGCLIIAVDAYMVAADPILVGILCGVAYLAMSAWMIYS